MLRSFTRGRGVTQAVYAGPQTFPFTQKHTPMMHQSMPNVHKNQNAQSRFSTTAAAAVAEDLIYSDIVTNTDRLDSLTMGLMAIGMTTFAATFGYFTLVPCIEAYQRSGSEVPE